MIHYVICPVCKRKVRKRHKGMGWRFVPKHSATFRACIGFGQRGTVVKQAQPDMFLRFT